jgi:hypothetical protein
MVLVLVVPIEFRFPILFLLVLALRVLLAQHPRLCNIDLLCHLLPLFQRRTLARMWKKNIPPLV